MRQRRLKNEINVVPYIDVMLVLLVIFMVTTPMMTTGSVDLPSTGTSSEVPPKTIRVEVKEDGSLAVIDAKGQSTKVTRKELGSTLASLKAVDQDTPILVAGDKITQYGNVVSVLDEIKKLHFKRVGLETSAK